MYRQNKVSKKVTVKNIKEKEDVPDPEHGLAQKNYEKK